MSHFTWSLVKKHNAFLVKRNGETFSRESNNLLNKHSYKWSGLAHRETVGVNFGAAAKGAVLTLKSRNAHIARRPASSTRTLQLKKDFRRVARAIKSETAGQYYRRDLTQAALARWTKISQTNSRIAKAAKSVEKK